ncbi:MAG: fumarate hydratase [Spirochaetales bacterium]|jgi:fumarate hydratase class I
MSQADLTRYLDFAGRDAYAKLDIPAPERRAGRLFIDAAGLAELSRRAFSEIAFKFPLGHLEQLARILSDPEASASEKFVAEALLRNAAIAAEGLLPICQDTGTALIYGWKGSNTSITTADGANDADDAVFLSRGAEEAYLEKRLRKSQLGPETVLTEKNTKDNLPAMVDLRAVPGAEYKFLFAAKGGGSTSRTSLSMESPAILREEILEKTLTSRIKALGASGCPPYTIAIVLGGSTPSQTLYALELAAYGLLDTVPGNAEAPGAPLRSAEWEAKAAAIAEKTGIGAQWGGKYLALETRFIRLSRHAANLPLGIGVSCSAHRKARAIVDESGWYLEKMENDPGRLLPTSRHLIPGAVEIDLDAPTSVWLEALRKLPAGTGVSLSGTVTVARDAAHARIAAGMRDGKAIPPYFAEHPIFYAGPTDPAPGQATGSFGPTTASRMDSYLEPFMKQGASLVTIAKGGRGKEAAEAIAAAGGVYLACIGGAAALTARDNVLESRIIDHADLGMEAVRLVRLKNLPALVIIDARGSSFYS